MPNYYVRVDGNNGNSGLTPDTNGAWQTITYALANMTLGSGDNYLYIAPGTYRESPVVTITPSSTNRLIISGNPTGSLFSGIQSNNVRLTGSTTDSTTMSTGHRLNLGSKTYVTVENLYIEVNGSSSSSFGIYGTGNNITIQKCVVYSYYTNTGSLGGCIGFALGSSTNNAVTIQQCILRGSPYCIWASCPNATSGVSGFLIQNCQLISNGTTTSYGFYWISQSGADTASASVINSIACGHSIAGIWFNNGNAVNTNKVQNCIIYGCATGISNYPTTTNTSSYNLLNNTVNVSSTSLGTGTVVSDFIGIDFGQALLQGFNNIAALGSFLGSRNRSFGNSTNAPATDIYGVAWGGTSPDVGTTTYRVIDAVTPYNPTERNASAITIAPGSTSQSIELYLGATGLTASTSGLSARYNRTRTASVSIPLVARTIAQAWTSGGFAEVDATNMPGVYRLDLPDAALAAGADDVTVVVRGASGTNGAVMTVKLSSGGLTSAQTASAVWGASPAGYSDATTFGGVVNEISNTVTGIDNEVQDIAGNVWDELRSGHTTVGTFGQYVNAELVTPVTSAALVRMGPFEVRADGLGASDPLDIQKGAQHGIDIQCVDNNGAGIDITSATVTAKVYNSGATLVDTYSCTATYAADGRATFTIDTTVTNTPGTYTATITRTTGASDTQVFGPLRIYVRDI
jgi:hypothetical protein